MKIIFLFEDFEIGGVERVYLNLINNINKTYKNVEIFVIAKSSNGNLKEYFQKTIIYETKNLKKFFETIENLCPDIIFCTKTNLTLFALAARVFSKYKKFKIITAIHNPLILRGAKFTINLKRLIGSFFIFRIVDKIVTISVDMKNSIKKLSKINNKIIVIENPVLDHRIDEMAKEPVDISFDYLVAVGRLEYQKGYDIMIEITLEFLKKYSEFKNVKLLILGDGYCRRDILRMIENKKLEENVILYGNTNNPYKYIKNAKCLILTSRWEGFPTVLIESAYLGCPYMAFDCKFGPREIVQTIGGGYLVPYGNKTEFVDKIYKVLKEGYVWERAKILKSLEPYFINNSSEKYYKLFSLEYNG